VVGAGGSVVVVVGTCTFGSRLDDVRKVNVTTMTMSKWGRGVKVMEKAKSDHVMLVYCSQLVTFIVLSIKATIPSELVPEHRSVCQ